MRYYPVFLDIKGRPCTVIGGGAVAQRKVEGLIDAGAKITVISPKVTAGIQKLVKQGKAAHLKKIYKNGDLCGSTLAIAAASNTVNRAVSEEAASSGIPVNVVDNPGLCSFIVPSIIDRGSLVIAISTSGASPLLAKTLRKDLEKRIGPEYGTFTELLGAVRNKLLKNRVKDDKKERIIKALIESPIPGWLKEKSYRKVAGFMKELLGVKFTPSKLGIRLKDR